MISVIMSVYNERIDWLKAAVSSILNQTYTDFEYIIIIDNPNLNDEAVSFLNNTAERDSRVQLHFNEANIGLMKSLNVGIQMVRGEFIARMDADDVSFPDRLEKEIAFLKENGYDMISANRVDIDEEGNEISRNSHIKNDPEKHLPYTNFIVHPSVLIKTEVMRNLGGYREFYNSEDYDMWLRVLSAGFKIGVMDDYVVYYRIRQTSMSLKNRLETYYITKYQQQLYWERKKTGKDSFSINSFRNYMNSKDISAKENYKYCAFRENMDVAISKFKEKKPSFIGYLVKAFFAFPRLTMENIHTIIQMR